MTPHSGVGSDSAGRYVDLDGLRTYVETAGNQEESVVLLHGGYATAVQWRHQVPVLGQHFRVSAPERRAHGRTQDTDGPISFQDGTRETIAFLELPEVGPSHLIGHSDGAIIGVLVAIARPDLVKKLVPMGVYVNRAGIRPEVIQSMESMEVTRSLKFERDQYGRLSPDGAEHWPIVFEKIARMWREEPDIPIAELENIRSPTLIVQADDDVATDEHLHQIFNAIPDCQLAVLPGTSHAFILEKPDLVNRLLLEFLLNDQADPWMPVRRASKKV